MLGELPDQGGDYLAPLGQLADLLDDARLQDVGPDVLLTAAGELLHALSGRGALLKDSPIWVPGRQNLTDSFVAVAYSADEADIRKGIAVLERASISARRAVANFAPALDLCNITRSRPEGLIDNGSTAEDNAGGSLILQEAGGKVKDLGRPQWDVLHISVVAFNDHIHDALLKLVEAP